MKKTVFGKVAIAALIGRISLFSHAEAQDWKAKYPELAFAAAPAENASGVAER